MKNIIEETAKRLMQLSEYQYYTETPQLLLDEDDDNTEEPSNTEEPTIPNMDGMSDDTEVGNDDINSEIDEPDMGDDMDIDEPDMGDDMGDTTDVDNSEDDFEEVVDITDLTQTNSNIENEIKQIQGMLNQVIDMCNANVNKEEQLTKEFENIKQEIIKRNPNPTEKLNMRSLDSYPYNVKLDDFWTEKQANSNYSIEDYNNEQEYILTQNDINQYNPQEVAKTLNQVPISMNDILKY